MWSTIIPHWLIIGNCILIYYLHCSCSQWTFLICTWTVKLSQTLFSTLEINNVTSHWSITWLSSFTILRSVALHVTICLVSSHFSSSHNHALWHNCRLHVSFLWDQVFCFVSRMYVMACHKFWKTDLSESCSVTLYRLLHKELRCRWRTCATCCIMTNYKILT